MNTLPPSSGDTPPGSDQTGSTRTITDAAGDLQLSTTVALIDGVQATLRLASGMLAAQRIIGLSGLDRMVGLVCARSLDLPPDVGRAIRPRLLALLADIDALAARQPPGLPP